MRRPRDSESRTVSGAPAGWARPAREQRGCERGCWSPRPPRSPSPERARHAAVLPQALTPCPAAWALGNREQTRGCVPGVRDQRSGNEQDAFGCEHTRNPGEGLTGASPWRARSLSFPAPAPTRLPSLFPSIHRALLCQGAGATRLLRATRLVTAQCVCIGYCFI